MSWLLREAAADGLGGVLLRGWQTLTGQLGLDVPLPCPLLLIGSTRRSWDIWVKSGEGRKEGASWAHQGFCSSAEGKFQSSR